MRVAFIVIDLGYQGFFLLSLIYRYISIPPSNIGAGRGETVKPLCQLTWAQLSFGTSPSKPIPLQFASFPLSRLFPVPLVSYLTHSLCTGVLSHY